MGLLIVYHRGVKWFWFLVPEGLEKLKWQKNNKQNESGFFVAQWRGY